jgi:xanthine dehydrogenase accessory factor
MLDIITELDEWIQSGEEIALATVVSTWGSAPRPVGSRLAVTRTGRFAGSVSGGCVEGAVIEASQEVLESGKPQLLTFGVADEQAWEVGLACGGTIQVFIEPYNALSALYPTLKETLDNRKPAALVHLLSGPGDSLNHKLLLSNSSTIHGDLQLPVAQQQLLELARAQLRKGESIVQQLEDDISLFIETFLPRPRIIIVGAVHITQSLLPMAHAAGFETIVIDPRGAFATEERFKQAGTLLKAWPQEALPDLQLGKYDYIVVLSHDPKLDDPALKIALSSSAGYIGALGSRHTHKDRLNRLKEFGLSNEQLARIHAPIGLPLGGRSTGEVAVSILAEILLTKNGIEFHVTQTPHD